MARISDFSKMSDDDFEKVHSLNHVAWEFVRQAYKEGTITEDQVFFLLLAQYFGSMVFGIAQTAEETKMLTAEGVIGMVADTDPFPFIMKAMLATPRLVKKATAVAQETQNCAKVVFETDELFTRLLKKRLDVLEPMIPGYRETIMEQLRVMKIDPEEMD